MKIVGRKKKRVISSSSEDEEINNDHETQTRINTKTLKKPESEIKEVSNGLEKSEQNNISKIKEKEVHPFFSKIYNFKNFNKL